MPVVAVTDLTFPSVEIEEWTLHAARDELRATKIDKSHQFCSLLTPT